MKTVFSFILMLIFTQFKAQGIVFETEWKVAVEKATKENKMIFMDIYTTWCRPCKAYDKKVFSDSTVGVFYNQNFINLKCNAEIGWGIKANEHYGFALFPTFLFIDPVSFEPFYRIDNYNQNTKDFIAEGIKANQYRNEVPLTMMIAEYDKGRRDREFLRKLIARKSSINLDFTNDLIEFMRIYPLEELTKENYINWRKTKIVFGSPAYYKIKSRINQSTMASDNNKILVLVSAQAIVDTAINRKDEKLLEFMLNELRSLGETNQKTDYLRIEFYQKLGNIEKAFSLTDRYVSQYLLIEKIEMTKKRDSIYYANMMNPYFTGLKDSILNNADYEFIKTNCANHDARSLAYKLNKIADIFILKTTDKAALQKLLQWTTLSMDLEPNYEPIFKNYALALYKNNEYQKSINTMKRGIELMNKELAENDSDRLTEEATTMKELYIKMQNKTL